MAKFEIGDVIEMPKDQFELTELVIENKWIITSENEKILFVKSKSPIGFCHTGIFKDKL